MKPNDDHFKIAAALLVTRGEFKSEDNALKSLRHLWAMVDAMEYADDEQEIRERYLNKEVVLLNDYTVPGGRPGIVAPVLKKGTRWVVVGAEGSNALVSESHGGKYDPRHGLYSVDSGQLDLVSGYSEQELADLAGPVAAHTHRGAPVVERPIVVVRPVELPAVLFDTHAVWKRTNNKPNADVSPEHVARVLDAVVAMMKEEHGNDTVAERNRREGTAP